MLEDFEQIKQKAETYYKSLKPMICPIFNEMIYFTSDGFHHLRFDNTRAERSKVVQRTKLKSLPWAINIIQKTTTVQEFRKNLQIFGKQGKDGFSKTVEVKYWAFIAITNIEKALRIRVIVRQVGNGQKHFWSVMPFWKELMKMVDGQSIKSIGGNELEDI